MVKVLGRVNPRGVSVSNVTKEGLKGDRYDARLGVGGLSVQGHRKLTLIPISEFKCRRCFSYGGLWHPQNKPPSAPCQIWRANSCKLPSHYQHRFLGDRTSAKGPSKECPHKYPNIDSEYLFRMTHNPCYIIANLRLENQ